jgi:hypothetical protein
MKKTYVDLTTKGIVLVIIVIELDRGRRDRSHSRANDTRDG